MSATGTGGKPPPSAQNAVRVSQVPPADSVPSTADTQPPRPDGYIMEKGPYSHGACGRWWTGQTVGHCSGCHREFTSGAFDPHQRIRDGVVTCSTAGLTPHEKPWGTLWALPGRGYWDAR